MQCMLLAHSNEAGIQATSQEDIGRMVAAYGAYTHTVQRAGIMIASDRLRPSTAATTVRAVAEDVQRQDERRGAAEGLALANVASQYADADNTIPIIPGG